MNFHDGPLPERAGLNTPNWAILEGAAEHGITWHMIEGGVDEGDILAQRRFAVSEDETAFSLNSKCYGAALDSFAEVLDQLESGTLNRQPQDLSLRRYHARADRPKAAGALRFDRPVAELLRIVRGLDMGGYWNPLTTAKIRLADQFVAVGQAHATEGAGAAGEILAVTGDDVTIACADGAIRLGTLTTLSGAPLSLRDLLRAGDVLLFLPRVTSTRWKMLRKPARRPRPTGGARCPACCPCRSRCRLLNRVMRKPPTSDCLWTARPQYWLRLRLHGCCAVWARPRDQSRSACPRYSLRQSPG